MEYLHADTTAITSEGGYYVYCRNVFKRIKVF